MADVFISFATEDLDRVHPFVRRFHNQGLHIFWAPMMPSEGSWVAQLSRKMIASKSTVVFWTEHSICSAYVDEEADMAKRAGKLVSVRLDPVSPPLGFKSLQYIDFSEDAFESYDEALTRLTQQVARTARLSEGVLRERRERRRVARERAV